jgi:hypothetical protein
LVASNEFIDVGRSVYAASNGFIGIAESVNVA